MAGVLRACHRSNYISNLATKCWKASFEMYVIASGVTNDTQEAEKHALPSHGWRANTVTV